MAEETRKPVKYIALEASNINNELIQVGQEVWYAGLPSKNLQPTDDEGRARAKEFEDADRKRQQQQSADNQESAVGDPEKFAAALGKELAKQKEESDAKFAEMQQQGAEDRAQIKQLLAALTNAVPAVVHTDAQKAPGTMPEVEAERDSDDKADTKQPAKRTRSE